MDNQLDVLKRTQELAESGLISLHHIKSKIIEGFFGETIRLMDDLVNAFYHMEKSLHIILAQLPPNNIEESSNKLRSALDQAVSAYEQGQGGAALEIIQNYLLPIYNEWKTQLEAVLRP